MTRPGTESERPEGAATASATSGALQGAPQFCVSWARGHAEPEIGSGALEPPSWHLHWDHACRALKAQVAQIEAELLERHQASSAETREVLIKIAQEACTLANAELEAAGGSGHTAQGRERVRCAAFSFSHEHWSWHGRIDPVPDAVSDSAPATDGEGHPAPMAECAGPPEG